MVFMGAHCFLPAISNKIIIAREMSIIKKIHLTFILLLVVLFLSVVPSAGAMRGGEGLDDYGDCRADTLNASNCGIVAQLNIFINILAAVVGIVIVVMIVWGGIQYTMSRDNPQQTAAAKEHIKNAILALVVYIFSIALLNWLVPGGILS